MDIWRERLAERLSFFCNKNNVSEADVARSLELDPRRFNKYKTSQREPEFQLLVRIAAAVETHPNYLLGVEDDPTWPRDDPVKRIEDKIDRLSRK